MSKPTGFIEVEIYTDLEIIIKTYMPSIPRVGDKIRVTDKDGDPADEEVQFVEYVLDQSNEFSHIEIVTGNTVYL